jgi:hypothetical protein
VSFPTSRRYPRTLAEAFPRDHACAVEHYRPTNGRLHDLLRATVGWVCVVAIGCFAAIGILGN